MGNKNNKGAKFNFKLLEGQIKVEDIPSPKDGIAVSLHQGKSNRSVVYAIAACIYEQVFVQSKKTFGKSLNLRQSSIVDGILSVANHKKST